MNIEIIDDFITLDEQEQLLKACSEPVWRYGWHKAIEPFEKPCMHVFIAGKGRYQGKDCTHELENSTQWKAIQSIWSRIKENHLQKSKLLGVYANGMTHGMETLSHKDNKPDNPSRTALIFPHGHWPQNWGGELVFLDDAREEIIKAVRPKPRRLVLFDGRISHAVRAPSALCNQMRISIAFKTLIDKE